MSSPVFSMRNYVISRRIGADVDEDPTGSLEFWPVKGSDELYEALKEAFPKYKTHKERMREAVLDFLLQERDQEAMISRSLSNASATASFNTVPETTMPSPAYFFQHQSQGSLQTTPDYLPSPESQFTNTFPSTPAAGSESANEQVSAIPNSMSVPGLREMTNVWSVSSNSQPKIRTRRAMTEAEKKEYRRKRADGACTDCRRRRRKCDHGSSSESDGSSKGVKKARKLNKAGTSTTAKHKLYSDHPHFLEQSSTGRSPTLSNNASPQQNDLSADLPSSMLWHEDSFEFSEIMDCFPGADVFDGQAMYDPIFDFVDFDQGNKNAEADQQITTRSARETLWQSTHLQQLETERSGMIMPLPSYYAGMEASQDHSSVGGMAKSPNSQTSIPLAQAHQRNDHQLAQEATNEGSRQSRPHDDQSQPEPERVRERNPHGDGRPIPPRLMQLHGTVKQNVVPLAERTLHSVPFEDGQSRLVTSTAVQQQRLQTNLLSSQSNEVKFKGAKPVMTTRDELRSTSLGSQLFTKKQRLGWYNDGYIADASSSSSSGSSPECATDHSPTPWANISTGHALVNERRSRELLGRLHLSSRSANVQGSSATHISISSDFAPGQVVRIPSSSASNTFVDTGTSDAVLKSPGGASHSVTVDRDAAPVASWLGNASAESAEAISNEDLQLVPATLAFSEGAEWFYKQRKLQRKGVNAGHVTVGNSGNGGTEPTVDEQAPDRNSILATERSQQQHVARKPQYKATDPSYCGDSNATLVQEPVVENLADHGRPAWQSRDSYGLCQNALQKPIARSTDWWNAQCEPLQRGVNVARSHIAAFGLSALLCATASGSSSFASVVAGLMVAFLLVLSSSALATIRNSVERTSPLRIAKLSTDAHQSKVAYKHKRPDASIMDRWWTHSQLLAFT